MTNIPQSADHLLLPVCVTDVNSLYKESWGNDACSIIIELHIKRKWILFEQPQLKQATDTTQKCPTLYIVEGGLKN